MANNYPKEIMVAWEDVITKFEDMNVMASAVDVASNVSAETMERTNDTQWKPSPYIMTSFDGSDQTSNFYGATGLTVPVRVNTRKSVPFTFTDLQLRDKMNVSRIVEGAVQRLNSDINKKVLDVVSTQGTVVYAKSTAAAGYVDVAQIDTAFNVRGVSSENRLLALNSVDYNNMASDIAGKYMMDPQNVTRAYREAYLGRVAGFDTLKLDYGTSLAAKGATGVTMAAANQYFTPAATTTVGSDELNKDNRYQTISIAVTSGTVKAGDCFTIAGVNSVHNISKVDTGSLQTFRIISIATGAGGTGTVVISPAIISAGGGTAAEKQYQNVTATPANGAVITFLNTQTKLVNPFWKKEAVELTPGIVVPESAGLERMSYTSPQGIQLVLTKQMDINTLVTKYRLDTYFGVTLKNPEMAGIMLFGQS